jgi:hypothetical protein
MFAREYNIISNRYHNGHNLRESTEKIKVLEETESKFHLTQLFDPIACRYKDQAKEEVFIGERKAS